MEKVSENEGQFVKYQALYKLVSEKGGGESNFVEYVQQKNLNWS